MTSVPPAGTRGPRRTLKLDEGTLIVMAAEAKAELDRAERLANEADAARARAAAKCAEMFKAGLSVRSVATMLNVTSAKAQRLIREGRRALDA